MKIWNGGFFNQVSPKRCEMVVTNFLLPPVTPLAPGVVAFNGHHLYSEPLFGSMQSILDEYPLLCYFVLYHDADEG